MKSIKSRQRKRINKREEFLRRRERRTLPKTVIEITEEIDRRVKLKLPHYRYAHLQAMLEGEIKCLVMGGLMSSKDAYLISDNYGVHGEWEKVEPISSNRF